MNRGFSLVEVLLAIAITALIMGSIYGTLFQGLESRNTIHNLSQEQAAGLSVLGLIERDIQGIFTYNVSGQQVFLGEDRSLRGQEADSIDLITTTDSKIPIIEQDLVLRTDVCEVGYRLRPNPDKEDFLEIWRRESYLFDDKPFEGGTFTLLYDRVKSFNVTYYTEPGPQAEEKGEWKMEDEETLPFALKIEMEIELRHRLETDLAPGPGTRKRTVRFIRTIVIPKEIRDSMSANIIPAIPTKAQGTGTSGQGSGENRSGG